MKIIQLQVDNVKGIRTATIRPGDEDVVVISGKNGAGKSSILDAMLLALAGGKGSRLVKQPIRRGETNATVKVDLGDFTVTKMWTASSGAVLDVRTKEGIQVPGQQAFLDKLNGQLWFDPLAFATMKESEQRAMLLDLIELPFDPEELEAAKKKVYDERTDANRDAKALKARLDALPKPETGIPDEEISTTTVMAEYKAAQDTVAENARKRERTEALGVAMDAAQQEIEDLDAKYKAAVAKREALEAEWNVALDASDELVDPDLTGFEAQLASVEETNVKIRAKRAHLDVLVEWQDADEVAKDLDNQLKVMTEAEREAIAEAAMPVDGLAFDESGVTFKGLPFKDLSSAEQLKISVGMGMALNPELRVMRIVDGPLLDAESLEMVAKLATENEYQVWVERIEGTTDYGFVIEDGTVVSSSTSTDDEHEVPSEW